MDGQDWGVDGDSIDVADLPLLGEPFAVEFANTDYRAPSEQLDVLSTPASTALWFHHASAAHGLSVPAVLSPSVVAALREVRDATRSLLLESSVDRTGTLDMAAIVTLNRLARAAPAYHALALTDGRLSWSIAHHESDDSIVAAASTRCIIFLGSRDLHDVRGCARPGCPMLFVQHHRARRFCHESCTHRLRQLRYRAANRPPRHSTNGTGRS